ncbi:MAG: hypothetical protein K1X57_13965 [Gemmataceae bacterium]|jgi:hypothetical protein|nr:hypothetical protein [Gemmataceae bacterium]
MARPVVAGIEETFPGANYSDDEREFIVAMDRLKRSVRFPTCSDILRVVHRLGYRKERSVNGSESAS